jgi:hypothetical protein
MSDTVELEKAPNPCNANNTQFKAWARFYLMFFHGQAFSDLWIP